MKYTLVGKTMTEDDIRREYGEVSYAYTNRNSGSEEFEVVAISHEEPQYMKSDLLLDEVKFTGVDTLMDIELFLEVL